MTVSLDALDADPYPLYAELRRTEPVAYVAECDLWFVTRWEDVLRVDSDENTFSAAVDQSAINRTLGRTMMHADGDAHRSIHAVVAPALRPATLRGAILPVIEASVDDLIDGFVTKGSADLVKEFAEPLAVRILSRVLGLPERPEHRMPEWFDAFAAGGANFAGDHEVQARADAASNSFDDAVDITGARASEAPAGSVLARMLDARDNGHAITDDQILANLKLMVLGGMQEPRDLICSTLWALLTHPDQLETVRREPSSCKRALEETLRWQSPVGTITRQVRTPIELGGVVLERGAKVAGVLASANRDEDRWVDPDRFDIARADGAHVAFAQGAHACIGSALARMEARIAIDRLIARLPDLRLDPSRPAELRGWEFRGPARLQMKWSA